MEVSWHQTVSRWFPSRPTITRTPAVRTDLVIYDLVAGVEIARVTLPFGGLVLGDTSTTTEPGYW